MMKTVSQFVSDASKQLNDQQEGREFTRWTRAFLVSKLNEALTEIQTYKPEAFARKVDITLIPGRLQSLDETLTGLAGGRLASIDKNKTGPETYEADFDLQRSFAPFVCCNETLELNAFGAPVFNIVSFAIDAKNPKNFYVSPPVPAGLSPVVEATVNGVPPDYDATTDLNLEIDIEPKYTGSLMDYVIGKALEIDQESVTSLRDADRHLGRFYTMLGVKYKYQAAYQAGNWNGKTEGGDPRSRV